MWALDEGGHLFRKNPMGGFDVKKSLPPENAASLWGLGDQLWIGGSGGLLLRGPAK